MTLADGGVNPVTKERVADAAIGKRTLAALGTFAPPLDPAGNSVKGRRVARHLSKALGFSLFAAQPRA